MVISITLEIRYIKNIRYGPEKFYNRFNYNVFEGKECFITDIIDLISFIPDCSSKPQEDMQMSWRHRKL